MEGTFGSGPGAGVGVGCWGQCARSEAGEAALCLLTALSFTAVMAGRQRAAPGDRVDVRNCLQTTPGVSGESAREFPSVSPAGFKVTGMASQGVLRVTSAPRGLSCYPDIHSPAGSLPASTRQHIASPAALWGRGVTRAACPPSASLGLLVPGKGRFSFPRNLACLPLGNSLLTSATGEQGGSH